MLYEFTISVAHLPMSRISFPASFLDFGSKRYIVAKLKQSRFWKKCVEIQVSIIPRVNRANRANNLPFAFGLQIPNL